MENATATSMKRLETLSKVPSRLAAVEKSLADHGTLHAQSSTAQDLMHEHVARLEAAQGGMSQRIQDLMQTMAQFKEADSKRIRFS